MAGKLPLSFSDSFKVVFEAESSRCLSGLSEMNARQRCRERRQMRYQDQ